MDEIEILAISTPSHDLNSTMKKQMELEIDVTEIESAFINNNNNNNKIWLFITHSTERNLRFFMHNCAYILKKTVRTT